MSKSAEKENGEFKDLQSKIDNTLLKARRVYISEAIMPESSAEVIKQLWYLELEDPGKPILLVISSPGGSIDAGFAIWDTAKMLKSPVYTLVTGLAASMGSILSLAGGKGHRYATKNARIMIHQPRIGGAIRGQATDLEIQANEITKTRKQLVDIYAESTGKDIETIDKALDRDSWMSAQEAMEFGLLDKLVVSFDEIPVS